MIKKCVCLSKENLDSRFQELLLISGSSKASVGVRAVSVSSHVATGPSGTPLSCRCKVTRVVCKLGVNVYSSEYRHSKSKINLPKYGEGAAFPREKLQLELDKVAERIPPRAVVGVHTAFSAALLTPCWAGVDHCAAGKITPFFL